MPAPPTGAEITITRTGGIAGVMQVVVVHPDGSWSFTDRRTGDTQQGKFTTAARDQIAWLSSNPGLANESRAAPPAANCADGFVYTIAVGEASTRYNQCGAGAKRPITDQLLAVVQDATPM